jgi:hypothetical protein
MAKTKIRPKIQSRLPRLPETEAPGLKRVAAAFSGLALFYDLPLICLPDEMGVLRDVRA